MKIIVERLFEHCGYPVLEFLSNEDAVNRFELFLNFFEGSPILQLKLSQKIVLEDNPINKGLALFPENQRNRVAALNKLDSMIMMANVLIAI